ncbi:NAAT family transporter [Methanocaldococcus sp.]|uniref:NAAT family transporter n=1 Tax=Methanocaldococcus sp. TaxID=2152917 RepID=UPI002605AD24|nr:NAAT family transporter [Methanocaldococcus sp.]MCQ6253997.1 NAAT family transporter [Methanocaldococcus sp.]
MDLFNFYIYGFVSLFITIDPIGLIPIFHSITYPYPKEQRVKIIKKAIITSTIVLLLFALFGNYIFSYFGITINAFRVAGGILLFKIAWDMLHAEIPKTKHKPDEKIELEDIDSIVYVPLAIPLISGPGAITTTMILVSKAQSILDKIIVILSILSAMLISGIILSLTDYIIRRVNIYGINAFVRIMGLLLVAISVQIIFIGVFGLYKNYL